MFESEGQGGGSFTTKDFFYFVLSNFKHIFQAIKAVEELPNVDMSVPSLNEKRDCVGIPGIHLVWYNEDYGN